MFKLKRSSSKTPDVTIEGEFKDRALEIKFRNEVWPGISHRTGWICLISALFYTIAGIGPVLEFGLKPKIVYLLSARGIIFLIGASVFILSRKSNYVLVQILLVLFFGGIGVYESVEAVIFYKPDLEFSTPFTLLIIFLMYFLVPLQYKPIAFTAVFSSILYVLLIAIFSAPSWQNCIQLSIFFVFSNLLGTYFFIENARFRRFQYYALNRIETLNVQLAREVEEKEEANRILSKIAITDDLTGVPNRRNFLEISRSEWKRAKRYKQPMCLFIIDIDYFKKVNDSFGHQVGDMVLKKVASTIFDTLRSSDSMGRLGGEEFGVILPQMHIDDAFLAAERVRESVESLDFNSVSPSLGITISVGVTSIHNYDVSLDKHFKWADDALYMAKNEGRNRTIIYRES